MAGRVPFGGPTSQAILSAHIAETPDLLATWGRSLEAEEKLWDYRKPLNIDVRGDVAVVLYVVETGPQE